MVESDLGLLGYRVRGGLFMESAMILEWIVNQRAGCWGGWVDRVDRCTGLGCARFGVNCEETGFATFNMVADVVSIFGCISGLISRSQNFQWLWKDKYASIPRAKKEKRKKKPNQE